jgi:hypothetical protein
MSSGFTLDYQKKNLPSRNTAIGGILVLLGVVIAAVAFMVDPQRASFNTIISMMFLVGVGFGSLFLVALEYIVGAVWSVPFRRITEFLTVLLFIAPILVIPLFFNMHGIFEWTHKEVVANDPFLSQKTPYLNEMFFIIRTVAIFVLMWLFYFLIVGKSQKQDKTNNSKTSKTITKISALFMPLFAVSITVFAIDWLMTLEPHWFSTIFGVYYFAGSLLTALAVTTFAAVTLNEAGYMSKYIKRDHYYNLGALMFAFVNFWAYIAFSQFLLIWYANIPEETFWFVDRWQGVWAYLSIILIVVKFAVPYALLLSQPSKSNPKRLKFAAVWIIVAQIYDLYWLVMPTYSKHHHTQDTAYFGWMELAIPLLIAGMLILVFNLAAKKKNLIAVNDPKIKSGLEFHL